VPPPSLQAPAATRTQIAPEASTPTSTPKRVSQLDIPLRTWVARAYNTPNAPASTHAGSGYGSKHLRAAQDFQNGKVYFAGGDYYSSVSPWFGIWSYDPITNKWEMEHSYCGSPGNIMPPGLDEVGWVWDSKRNLFWMLPGYTVSRRENPNLPQCVGGATEVGGILTFDPATKKWANPGIPVEPVGSPPGSAQRAKNAIYDPVTDSIYRSSVDHRGFIWTVLNLSTKSWNVYQTVAATDRTYINNVDLGFEQLAADIAGRKIYAIDPFFYRLLAFDIDSKTISIKAPIPVLDPQRVAQARATVARPHIWQDFTMPVFDSVNRKLLFPYIDSLDTARPKLLIYDPETNSWETDKMHQPEGREVRGNTALFLPVHNAMMILGGLAPGGDADPTVTHFFLYRYGPGSGQSPIREK